MLRLLATNGGELLVAQIAPSLEKVMPGFAYSNYGCKSMKQLLLLPELASCVREIANYHLRNSHDPAD